MNGHRIISLFVLALLLASPASWASHHGWRIVEVFSNADGTL